LTAFETLADAVAAAALAVPGVAHLHTGSFGEVATYLPGRRVEGVRLAEQTTEVHVVVSAHTDLRAVAQRVRLVVTPLVGGAVDVFIEDLELLPTPVSAG
jgi:hypothetical protein